MKDTTPGSFPQFPSVKNLQEALPQGPKDSGVYLCEKCSVIRFDEENLGGYEGISDSGQPMLTFDIKHKKKILALDYYHEDVFPELPGLQISAEAGCGFCKMLRDAILEDELPLPATIKIRLSYVWGGSSVGKDFEQCGLYGLIAEITPRVNDTTEVVTTCLLFVAEKGSGNCGSWLQIQDTTTGDALCKENITKMKYELNRCHRECDVSKRTDFVPTRLLDLSANETTDGIRLIESEKLCLNEALQYAALSYCWGSASDAKTALKTDRSSLESHLTNIPVNSTFGVVQDAIVTARSLSIRYLWVDALCIIQGDSIDWKKESQIMESVYGNAYVTIAALSSPSCHKGFLQRPAVIELRFISSIRQGFQGTYYLRHQRYHQKLESGWMTHEYYPTLLVADLDLKHQRWSNRAWTYQEQESSRRLLGFGSSRIYFQCATRFVKESSPGPWQKSESVNVEAELDRKYKYGSVKRKEKLYTAWALSVEVYSARELTDPRDKLPAISAIAERVQKLAGGEEIYLAGTWKGDLPLGLLWSINEPEVEALATLLARSSLPPFISPTWSWASQEIAVTFLRSELEIEKGHDFRPECEIASVWTKLEDSSNVYGRIQDAVLIVNARLVLFEPVVSEDKCMSLGGWWELDFDEEGSVELDLDWVSDEEELHLQDVFMLLLASTLHSPGSEGTDTSEDDDTSSLEDDDTGSTNNYCHASVKDDYTDSGKSDCHDVAGDNHNGQENSTHINSNQYDGFGSGNAEDNHSGSSQCSIGTTGSVVQDKTCGRERKAWGILLHPAEEEGKYVRIGQFSWIPKDGGSSSGLRAFDSCNFQSVEII